MGYKKHVKLFKKTNVPPDIINLSNSSAVSPTSDLTNVNTTDLDAAAEALLKLKGNQLIGVSSLEE